MLCHLIKLASVVTRAEQTDKADTRQITLTSGAELESDTKEMKQAKDQPRTVVFILLCCGTLSDDQLDAVGPRDVGDAAVVGAVPQPHVGDEQLAGGHRDNLRRGDGVIIIIIVSIIIITFSDSSEMPGLSLAVNTRPSRVQYRDTGGWDTCGMLAVVRW